MAIITGIMDFFVILENALGKITFVMMYQIATIPLMNLFVEVRKP